MSLKILNVNAAEIKEGINSLERLKDFTVRGHGGDIAENLYRLRRKMSALVERRKTLDEVYIRKDLDGEPIPDSKPRIDVDRYMGEYKPTRTYKLGTIIQHKGVMLEVQEEVKGVEPPDDAYVAVGKVVENSFRTKDGYYKSVMDLEGEEQAVHIRTVPKAALDEIEELPGVCYFFPMLEMEELDGPVEEEAVDDDLSESNVSTNGELVENDAEH